MTDPNGNTVTSPRSAAVTVSATPLSDYTRRVLADHPSTYWRLGEASGTTVYDAAGFDDAVAAAGVTRDAVGAITADPDLASGFNGATDGSTSTKKAVPGPDTFAVETWIRTTSTSGGKIAGFGSANTDVSSSYDRHLYLDDAGRIWFGAYPNEVRTVNSVTSYNDGQWHHVVGTLGANGLVLYVDGKRVGRDPATTSAEAYQGYWRLGGDNLTGWPSQPASAFLAGTIDDTAIYDEALTWEQVVAHYTASGRSGDVVPSAPVDTYGRTVYRDNPAVYFRLNDTGGTTATDSGPNGIDGGITGGVTLGAASGSTVPGLRPRSTVPTVACSPGPA